MVVLNIKNRIKSLVNIEIIKSERFKRLILGCKEFIYNKPNKFIKTSKEIRKWVKNNRIGSPPQSYRHKIIKMYAKEFSINTFIETGTYLGKTIEDVKNVFKKIYSIELDKALYLKAKQKFIKYNHINIIKGDSSEKLPTILSKIEKPCLFWLDAHYSEGITSKTNLETPISKELLYILNHPNKNHVILIDDAHKFTGTDDYPTIAELKDLISQHQGKLLVVKDYIIRIHNRP